MNAIEIQKLTKYYGSHLGIENVDLQVEEGDFFGFIGPNGAGKSTTIRTLLGLIKPTSGTAKVLGMPIGDQQLAILSKVGYLPSDASFYPNMKVQDLIAFSASLRKQDCSAEAKVLCERLDLDPTRKIRELSLGNRKKLGIVCALQHKPNLYILDEPTGGLDPLMQKEFYDILTERNKEGATIFLSSHILSEVSRYCKTAAVISNGKILACESVEKLNHTGVKRITLRGIQKIPSISGIRDVTYEEDTIQFLYSGDPKELLDRLSKLSFRDINITDPDLEEIFMHYYRKDGAE